MDKIRSASRARSGWSARLAALGAAAALLWGGLSGGPASAVAAVTAVGTTTATTTTTQAQDYIHSCAAPTHAGQMACLALRRTDVPAARHHL